MRARHCSSSSTGVSSPRRMNSAASVMVVGSGMVAGHRASALCYRRRPLRGETQLPIYYNFDPQLLLPPCAASCWRVSRAPDLHAPALPHRVQHQEPRAVDRPYLAAGVACVHRRDRPESQGPPSRRGRNPGPHPLARPARADRSISDVVRDIKSNSSGWLHDRGVMPFAWQDGYGAFTLDPSGIPGVTAYINNQVEHHATTTFRDEFLAMLTQHEVEYDRALPLELMLSSPRRGRRP